MIGIYKFTNKINGHSYIGQSVDIERRRYMHRYSAYNKNDSEYDSQFHQAIRKYGWENFTFEVIQEISDNEYSQELLNTLEIFFIEYFDTYKKGYNATKGGSNFSGKNVHKGEKNGRALLTEKEVKEIREAYNQHIPFKQVYEKYKTKISKRGLQNIWWFKTWKNIYPEYHTEENRKWHKTQAKANPSDIAAQNQRHFSDEEVKEMRELFKNGKTPTEIWKQYCPEVSWSTVYNLVNKKTYKNIE